MTGFKQKGFFRSLLFCLSLALLSCASGVGNKKIKTNQNAALASCRPKTIESRHASIAVRSQASKFAGCLSNYMRLRNLSEFDLAVCADIGVKRDGSVSYASARGAGDSLPNELKWCLEQELWKTDFSKLQFESSQKIRFPIRFEVRRPAGKD